MALSWIPQPFFDTVPTAFIDLSDERWSVLMKGCQWSPSRRIERRAKLQRRPKKLTQPESHRQMTILRVGEWSASARLNSLAFRSAKRDGCAQVFVFAPALCLLHSE